MQAVAVGATNLVFTLVGMSLIDRAGRKWLMLVGCVGLTLCLGVGKCRLLDALPPGLAGLAADGLYRLLSPPRKGAVTWVYIGEIFPHPRSRQRPESRLQFALGHECHHLRHLSDTRG